MTPRIVIGMSVYNEDQYLHETIPAVLNQTETDFRLLILDNGSTDRSAAILQSFAAFDERIALLHSPTNLDPPFVGNLVFGEAIKRWPDCRWFMGAGADDLMDEDYVAAILAAAEMHPDANCIYSPRRWIGHAEMGERRYPEYNPDTVHEQVQIPGWRAFTRELWDALGGEDERIRIGADWDWAVRASALGIFRPLQLDRAYLSIRIRGPGRKSQSEEVDWRSLYRHLCRVNGKPIASWAC